MTAVLSLVSASLFFLFLLAVERDPVIDALFAIIIFLALLFFVPIVKFFLFIFLVILIIEVIKEIF